MPVFFSSFSFSRIICLLSASIFLLTLSGCSSNFKSFTDSVKAAAELSKGANVSPEYIASVPYASRLVTINNNKPIFMVLAFADQYDKSAPHQLTWLAKDTGNIVTQHGRIIQTNGFDDNNLAGVAYSSMATSLPLPGDALGDALKAPFTVTYDWSPGYRYGFTATVETRSLGRETLVTDLWREEVEHFTETVTFQDLEAQFTNHYWRVPATDTVPAYIIKSIQYLGPNMDRVEMLTVRPFIEPASIQAIPAPAAPRLSEQPVLLGFSSDDADADAARFLKQGILLLQGGRLSEALDTAYRQAALQPGTPYFLGTHLVNLGKQPLVDAQREAIVQQLTQLATPAATRLAQQLMTMQFAYFERIATNINTVRLAPKQDPMLKGDFWLSLPQRPEHIDVLHPRMDAPLRLPNRGGAHLNDYLAALSDRPQDARALPKVHQAWIIQADRRVHFVENIQWRDSPYYLSPGAMVFVGLEDLPAEHRDLNAKIAQLLAFRLEL